MVRALTHSCSWCERSLILGEDEHVPVVAPRDAQLPRRPHRPRVVHVRRVDEPSCFDGGREREEARAARARVEEGEGKLVQDRVDTAAGHRLEVDFDSVLVLDSAEERGEGGDRLHVDSLHVGRVDALEDRAVQVDPEPARPLEAQQPHGSGPSQRPLAVHFARGKGILGWVLLLNLLYKSQDLFTLSCSLRRINSNPCLLAELQQFHLQAFQSSFFRGFRSGFEHGPCCSRGP
mmetsp:Transcript_63081/g.95213  ORF Transcript_63081/g.95213 Transcript_63081/m.95213 type:complete len:234 (+) Transcript_63081:302-1003(+)